MWLMNWWIAAAKVRLNQTDERQSLALSLSLSFVYVACATALCLLVVAICISNESYQGGT
jgi:hypothetical protein